MERKYLYFSRLYIQTTNQFNHPLSFPDDLLILNFAFIQNLAKVWREIRGTFYGEFRARELLLVGFRVAINEQGWTEL